MKVKVYVVDLEIPLRVKKWGLRIGIPLGLLFGGGAIAWAAGLHTWSNGDTLNATDLNGNFTLRPERDHSAPVASRCFCDERRAGLPWLGRGWHSD
jgi:hypothetical protein